MMTPRHMDKPEVFLFAQFRDACVNGHLTFAQWLISMYPMAINPRAYNDEIFAASSRHGQLRVMQWLYSLYPDIDLRAVFPDACANGRTDIVMWLLSACPAIDPRANNDEAPQLAHTNGHEALAHMLRSLRPRIDMGAVALFMACVIGVGVFVWGLLVG